VAARQGYILIIASATWLPIQILSKLWRALLDLKSHKILQR
jgi:hypothetical protein